MLLKRRCCRPRSRSGLLALHKQEKEIERALFLFPDSTVMGPREPASSAKKARLADVSANWDDLARRPSPAKGAPLA
jgi:hypothetical protein